MYINQMTNPYIKLDFEIFSVHFYCYYFEILSHYFAWTIIIASHLAFNLTSFSPSALIMYKVIFHKSRYHPDVDTDNAVQENSEELLIT